MPSIFSPSTKLGEDQVVVFLNTYEAHFLQKTLERKANEHLPHWEDFP